jgi:hypothetical protein
MFFSRFEYHMFYVLYPFVAHLLTPPRETRSILDSSVDDFEENSYI